MPALPAHPAAPDALGLAGYVDAVEVAAGASAVVWRARQPAFDRTVAVKVLLVPLREERVRARFARELALTGRMTGHPNIVTALDSGTTEAGRAYVTLPWFASGSLEDVLARSGPADPATVARMAVKLAGALATAHALGVVHRDVKPANVLMSAYGEPALADFGIAVATSPDGPDALSTSTSAMTPAHAAPEVLEGRPAGDASDVWSLASTLHTLLAGTPPFAPRPGESVLATMLRVLGDPVPAIPRSDVPPALLELIASGLHKDPAARPTAEALGRTAQQVQRAQGWPVSELPLQGPPTVEPRLPAPAPGTPGAVPPVTPAGPPAGQAADPGMTRTGDQVPAVHGGAAPAAPRRPGLLVGGAVAGVLLAVVASVALLTRGGGGAPAPPPAQPTQASAVGPPVSAAAEVRVTVLAGDMTGATVTFRDTNVGSSAHYGYAVVVYGPTALVQTVATTNGVAQVTGLDSSQAYCFTVGTLVGGSARPQVYSAPAFLREDPPAGAPASNCPAPPAGPVPSATP